MILFQYFRPILLEPSHFFPIPFSPSLSSNFSEPWLSHPPTWVSLMSAIFPPKSLGVFPPRKSPAVFPRKLKSRDIHSYDRAGGEMRQEGWGFESGEGLRLQQWRGGANRLLSPVAMTSHGNGLALSACLLPWYGARWMGDRAAAKLNCFSIRLALI